MSCLLAAESAFEMIRPNEWKKFELSLLLFIGRLSGGIGFPVYRTDWLAGSVGEGVFRNHAPPPFTQKNEESRNSGFPFWVPPPSARLGHKKERNLEIMHFCPCTEKLRKFCFSWGQKKLLGTCPWHVFHQYFSVYQLLSGPSPPPPYTNSSMELAVIWEVTELQVTETHATEMHTSGMYKGSISTSICYLGQSECTQRN